MPRYRRALDMERWRTDQRIAERGFNHAYDGVVEDGNGEDFFLDLVDDHLGPGADLLDVGCGHGDLTLDLATRCNSAVGVDRNRTVIDLARELAVERGSDNVRFECAELAAPDGRHTATRLPVDDDSVDLVVDRRGPPIERFVDDLRRVGRPGTTIVGLHPAGGPPPPPWANEVPTFGHRFDALDAKVVESWVVEPATRRGLTAYRLWWIDVPEHLPNPRALYDRLVFEGAPPFDTVAAELQRVFHRHGGPRGVILRHQRLAFTLTMP